METQAKQRVVGVIVLLVLVGAIALLLLFGLRQNEKAIDQSSMQGQVLETKAANGEVQLTLPDAESKKNPQAQLASEGQVSPTPRDVIKTAPIDASKTVSNNFGQLAATSSQNNSNTNPNTSADQISTQPLAQVAPTKTPAIKNAAENPVAKPANDITNVAPVSQQSAPTQEATTPSSNVVAANANVNDNQEQQPNAADMMANDAKKDVALDNSQANAKSQTNESSNSKPISSHPTNLSSPAIHPLKIKGKNKTITTKTKLVRTATVSKKHDLNLSKAKGWSVKVGSFVSPPNADSMVKKLRSYGFSVYTTLLVTQTQGVLTQVFVGPVPTQFQAIQQLKAVRSKIHVTGTIINNSVMVKTAPNLKSTVPVKKGTIKYRKKIKTMKISGY